MNRDGIDGVIDPNPYEEDRAPDVEPASNNANNNRGPWFDRGSRTGNGGESSEATIAGCYSIVGGNTSSGEGKQT